MRHWQVPMLHCIAPQQSTLLVHAPREGLQQKVAVSSMEHARSAQQGVIPTVHGVPAPRHIAPSGRRWSEETSRGGLLSPVGTSTRGRSMPPPGMSDPPPGTSPVPPSVIARRQAPI
jgi:hypothetical protein